MVRQVRQVAIFSLLATETGDGAMTVSGAEKWIGSQCLRNGGRPDGMVCNDPVDEEIHDPCPPCLFLVC